LNVIHFLHGVGKTRIANNRQSMETGDLVAMASSQAWRSRVAMYRPVTHVSDPGGQRLEILREIVPGLHRLAVIGNAGFPDAVPGNE